MKDTLIEIKNNLQGNNSRVDEAKKQIRDLKYKEAKSNQSEQQEEKRIQKNEDSVSSFWDNFKWSNICKGSVFYFKEVLATYSDPFLRVSGFTLSAFPQPHSTWLLSL